MIPVDLSAKLWAAANVKAVELGWPNAHAVVNALLVAWLQDRDASAGGRQRARVLGDGTRSRIAREAAEARWANAGPAERRAHMQRASDARWAAHRLAKANASTLAPLPPADRPVRPPVRSKAPKR